MLHRITATSLPPRGHGLSFEGIEKEYFTTIMIHEVIVCLNSILRTGHIVQINDQMPIFGNQIFVLIDDFLDTLDVFSRSAQNLLVKDIGIREDSLVNKFDVSVGESYDGDNRTFSL